MLSIALSASLFVTVVHEDPITRQETSMYATHQDGHSFALLCDQHNDLSIRVVPQYYRGAAKGIFLWDARADSRFGKQEKADKHAWYFGSSYLSFTGSGLPFNKRKAAFLDRMARDNEFTIRYEDRPQNQETITFRYQLNIGEMRRFIADCGDAGLNKRLRQAGSPLAPDAKEESDQ